MKLLLLIVLITVFPVFGQDAYVLKTDGSKISVDDASVRIITSDKKILFRPAEKGREQTLSFSDFDILIYNNFKFKSLNINKKTEKDGYFILAESNSKSLIFKILTANPQDEDELPKPIFQLLIIDEFLSTLSSFIVNDQTNIKNIEVRNQILLNIKMAFPNCDNLINRVMDYDKKNGDSKNLSILGIFNSPVYFDCK